MASNTPTLRPLGLLASLVYFGVPSAVFSSSILLLLPWMRRHGFGLYPTFVVTFLGPLALMLVAVLVAYGLERGP